MLKEQSTTKSLKNVAEIAPVFFFLGTEHARAETRKYSPVVKILQKLRFQP